MLFADLRGFTSLSEEQLPYDTVFVLNRYFAAMGAAIEEAGGHVDKFIGDAIMVIFGAPQDMSPDEQAKRAANCAIAMQREMARSTSPKAAPCRILLHIRL